MAPRTEPSIPESNLPECFDPYLRYAIATNFTRFALLDAEWLFFLVELKPEKSATEFANQMRAAEFDVEFGPDDDDSSLFATLRTGTAAVLERQRVDIWDEFFSSVELSLPLKQSSLIRSLIRPRLLDRWNEGQEPPGSLLIGVLDDGCPFAAAHFLRTSTSGATSTRVRGIWDQNEDKLPLEVKDGNGNPCLFGRTPTDFGYGVEFHRDFAAPGCAPRQMGLDEWINLHATPARSIDEDACYAEAGFTRLMRRQSHGAHVMDVFAGRSPTSARVGPSNPGQDRRDPPSWKPATDPACSADLVFVQFRDASIRDATGVWLKAYVFQGIQYILSFAHPTNTKKVVINLSYGPTTGPHNGTARLEKALRAFVAKFNGTPGKPKLEVVLAAGNAYLSEGHVNFIRSTTQPDFVEWTWRLPPDNAVLCFAEIWMKKADAGGVVVTLTSPSGITFYPTPPPPLGAPIPPAGVDVPIPRGNDKMWRLQVEPTIIAPNIAASEHGDYTIKVSGIRANAQLHAYVARSDPNMGVRTGAKRSYFVDDKWEMTRSAEASCKYIDGEFDKAGSLIHRVGTLNGIATGNDASVHVAGGYILANERKSPYSSAGPARGGLRVGPDVALPCDESCALGGIRAGGNRSGTVFRLTGTSAAAPQLGRWISNTAIPQPTATPTTPSETQKRGRGNLKPP